MGAAHRPLGPGCGHRDWGPERTWDTREQRRGGPHLYGLALPSFFSPLHQGFLVSGVAFFASPASTPGTWGAQAVPNLRICCFSGAPRWEEWRVPLLFSVPIWPRLLFPSQNTRSGPTWPTGGWGLPHMSRRESAVWRVSSGVSAAPCILSLVAAAFCRRQAVVCWGVSPGAGTHV